MWTPHYDIIVETLTGSELEVTVTEKDTIGYIKSRIQKHGGIPVNQQHLLYNHEELNDSTKLKDIPLSKGSRLKLVIGMKGGPVSARRVVTLPDYDSWFDLNDILNTRQDPLTISTPGVKLLVYKDCKKNIHRVMKFRSSDRRNSLNNRNNISGSSSNNNNNNLSNHQNDMSVDGLLGEDQQDDQWLQDTKHTMEKMNKLRTMLSSQKRNKNMNSKQPAAGVTATNHQSMLSLSSNSTTNHQQSFNNTTNSLTDINSLNNKKSPGTIGDRNQRKQQKQMHHHQYQELDTKFNLIGSTDGICKTLRNISFSSHQQRQHNHQQQPQQQNTTTSSYHDHQKSSTNNSISGAGNSNAYRTISMLNKYGIAKTCIRPPSITLAQKQERKSPTPPILPSSSSLPQQQQQQRPSTSHHKPIDFNDYFNVNTIKSNNNYDLLENNNRSKIRDNIRRNRSFKSIKSNELLAINGGDGVGDIPSINTELIDHQYLELHHRPAYASTLLDQILLNSRTNSQQSMKNTNTGNTSSNSSVQRSLSDKHNIISTSASVNDLIEKCNSTKLRNNKSSESLLTSTNSGGNIGGGLAMSASIGLTGKSSSFGSMKALYQQQQQQKPQSAQQQPFVIKNDLKSNSFGGLVSGGRGGGGGDSGVGECTTAGAVGGSGSDLDISDSDNYVTNFANSIFDDDRFELNSTNQFSNIYGGTNGAGSTFITENRSLCGNSGGGTEFKLEGINSNATMDNSVRFYKMTSDAPPNCYELPKLLIREDSPVESFHSSSDPQLETIALRGDSPQKQTTTTTIETFPKLDLTGCSGSGSRNSSTSIISNSSNSSHSGETAIQTIESTNTTSQHALTTNYHHHHHPHHHHHHSATILKASPWSHHHHSDLGLNNLELNFLNDELSDGDEILNRTSLSGGGGGGGGCSGGVGTGGGGIGTGYLQKTSSSVLKVASNLEINKWKKLPEFEHLNHHQHSSVTTAPPFSTASLNFINSGQLSSSSDEENDVVDNNGDDTSVGAAAAANIIIGDGNGDVVTQMTTTTLNSNGNGVINRANKSKSVELNDFQMMFGSSPTLLNFSGSSGSGCGGIGGGNNSMIEQTSSRLDAVPFQYRRGYTNLNDACLSSSTSDLECFQRNAVGGSVGTIGSGGGNGGGNGCSGIDSTIKKSAKNSSSHHHHHYHGRNNGITGSSGSYIGASGGGGGCGDDDDTSVVAGGGTHELSSLLRHRNTGHFDYVRSYENLDRTKIVRIKNERRCLRFGERSCGERGSNSSIGGSSSSTSDWKFHNNFDGEFVQEEEDSSDDYGYSNLGYENGGACGINSTIGSSGGGGGACGGGGGGGTGSINRGGSFSNDFDYPSNESLLNINFDGIEDNIFEIDKLALFEPEDDDYHDGDCFDDDDDVDDDEDDHDGGEEDNDDDDDDNEDDDSGDNENNRNHRQHRLRQNAFCLDENIICDNDESLKLPNALNLENYKMLEQRIKMLASPLITSANVLQTNNEQTIGPILSSTTSSSSKTTATNINNTLSSSPVTETISEPLPPPSPPSKPIKLRCAECNKRLGVIMVMKCHCEKIFCTQHRYAEAHNCTFNYKQEGKEILARENPLVIAQKLPKI